MILTQQLTLPTGDYPVTDYMATSVSLLIRLGIDLFAMGVLIRLIYYRIYRKSDLFLTFFTFNLIIFLITYLLNQVQMSIGAAFGLFAVFSMLRYRTEGLSAKDMTYLFVVIALGLISSVSQGGWVQVALIDGLIVLMVQMLEGNWFFGRVYCKPVQYDRIELIVPQRRAELLDDLRTRTGLSVYRVEIHDIDFLKDTAHMTIYYYPFDTPQHNDSPSQKSPAATRISFYE